MESADVSKRRAPASQCLKLLKLGLCQARQMMAGDSDTHEVRSDQRSTEATMLVAFTTPGDFNGPIPAQNGWK